MMMQAWFGAGIPIMAILAHRKSYDLGTQDGGRMFHSSKRVTYRWLSFRRFAATATGTGWVGGWLDGKNWLLKLQ